MKHSNDSQAKKQSNIHVKAHQNKDTSKTATNNRRIETIYENHSHVQNIKHANRKQYKTNSNNRNRANKQHTIKQANRNTSNETTNKQVDN